VSSPQSTVEIDRTLEPFFFRGLFGVWRAPQVAPRRVWVFCAPFAEEEKSAHRVVTEICNALVSQGDATLLFAYRGTGDSDGDFRVMNLKEWMEDIHCACREARRRAPEAELCLAGLRLGASLAWQIAAETKATRVVLIEPVLRGRAILSEIRQKKRLRAMVTSSEGGTVALPDDDFDGWPISDAMRASLESFEMTPQAVAALVIGVGARAELATPLQNWSRGVNAQTVGVKMPAFWNRLDTLSAAPLLETIPQW
jgi:hypothetical protein